MHHTHQLDVDQPTPVWQPLLPHGRLFTDNPCVVADEVNATESLDRLVGQGVNVGGLTHVGPHPDCPARVPRQRVDCRRNRILTHVGDHHVHAAPHQDGGQGEADAAGASGHHGDLSRFDLHGYGTSTGTSVYCGVKSSREKVKPLPLNSLRHDTPVASCTLQRNPAAARILLNGRTFAGSGSSVNSG